MSTIVAPRVSTSAHARAMVAGDDSSGKQECRSRVLHHLLEHHEGQRLRLFSLPSADWVFERMLHLEKARADFVSCERCDSVFRIARTMMPGLKRRFAFMESARGCIEVLHSECARMALCDLSALLAFNGRGQGRNDEAQHFHNRRWKRWTCVWLDFNSQMCREIESVLPRLSSNLCKKTAVVPIAVTVMSAREPADQIRKMDLLQLGREGWIVRLLQYQRFRTFVHDATFEHVGLGSTPMMTVMGRMFLNTEHTEVSG